MRLVILLLLAALAVGACGVKGPLYLPTDKPVSDDDSTTPGTKK